jgi:hypothetical protein
MCCATPTPNAPANASDDHRDDQHAASAGVKERSETGKH